MWHAAASLCAGALLLIMFRLVRWLHRWSNPSCSNGMLPPGSMGLPLLGETLQFFSPNTTSDVSPFIRRRKQRYGPIFKTSLLGRPVVVSTDPEFNQFVFLKEGQLFESCYPSTFAGIFGPENMGSLHGHMYKYLKSIVLRLFGSENLRERFFHEAADATRAGLASWSTLPSVELKDAIATMIFNLAAKKLISYDPSKATEDLKESYASFISGLISFPINLPGTTYHRCVRGREKVMSLLRDTLRERRQASPETRRGDGDFFDFVLEELGREETLLTEAMTLDLIFALLFASFETTSLALTMAVKLLADNPAVLSQLTEEHDAIISRREDPNSSRLTWEEYKTMAFTSHVIDETLRLANIVPIMFRRTLKDVKIKGYTIPKGWGVIVCPPSVHLNPDIFEDPFAFNPCRWKEESQASFLQRNLMAFGGGMRLCVGTDFARMEMSIFLHYLVTNYRWKAIKGGNISRVPGLAFPDGFYVQLFDRKLEQSG